MTMHDKLDEWENALDDLYTEYLGVSPTIEMTQDEQTDLDWEIVVILGAQ